MAPGPSLVDPEVLLEMAKPTLSHVSPEFDSLHKETLDMLLRVFDSSGRVLLIPGSGTSAMELALRSLVSRGTRVLVLKTGYFGGYIEAGVEMLGGRVIPVESALGEGFTGEHVRKLFREHEGIRVVALQHVETSTSVANPLREICEVASESDVRVLVDAVASAGGMEIRMDDWGIDVCFTGSQKALATPPGLGIVVYGRKLIEEGYAPASSLYFNEPKLLAEMETMGNYYITPAVNLVYALHASLRKIMSEGLSNRFSRHEALAEAVREALEEMGISLVAKEGFRANTVTAAYLPAGVDWPSLYGEMRKRGIEIAGGLGELKGKIFRIGHMGEVSSIEVTATIAALERSLRALGYNVALGSGLKAAQERLHTWFM